MNLLKELWMVLCLLWWCIQDDTLYECVDEPYDMY